MGASTGKEARVRAARKLRAAGSVVPLPESFKTLNCHFCGWCIGASRLRIGANGFPECRAVAACEKRMR